MIGTDLGDRLAALNATLNATSAVLVAAGWWAIKQDQLAAKHKQRMLAALAVSAVFLVSYLTRVAIRGTHNYPGHGALKAIYFGVLISHVTLAAAVPPLVLTAVWLAMKARFGAHKKVVRFALPIWLYVSITGVVVYVMLYQALPQ